MPSYELRIDGLVGPVVMSALAGFTRAEDSANTTLTGTAADIESLVAVVALLNARGFPPIDIAINHPNAVKTIGSELPSSVHARGRGVPRSPRSDFIASACGAGRRTHTIPTTRKRKRHD